MKFWFPDFSTPVFTPVCFPFLFLFLQLIRWTPEVAVCWPVCVRIRGMWGLFCSFLLNSCIKSAHILWTFLSFSFFFRRKKAVLQAWHPLEGRKLRKRKFSSVLWAQRVWASASLVVPPRNLVSTSAMSRQAPFLQKLDLRWLLKNTSVKSWHSLVLLQWTAFVIYDKNVGWRPDCGGERGGFHQCGPQRGEFWLIWLFVDLQ